MNLINMHLINFQTKIFPLRTSFISCKRTISGTAESPGRNTASDTELVLFTAEQKVCHTQHRALSFRDRIAIFANLLTRAHVERKREEDILLKQKRARNDRPGGSRAIRRSTRIHYVSAHRGTRKTITR